MVNSLSDLLGVHPDKLLSLVQPLHLELLLADRADAASESWVIWNGQVLHLGFAGYTGVGSAHAIRVVLIISILVALYFS